MMLFSQKLKKVMKERGLTTYRIQQGTGISQGNVDSWLKGRSKPRSANMKKLCDFLGVDVEYFVTDPPPTAVKEPTTKPRMTKKYSQQLRSQIGDAVDRVPPAELPRVLKIVQTFVE